MVKKFLEAGQIVSTHGVKGELNIVPWCDGPEFLTGFDRFYLKEGGQVLRVEQMRAGKTLATVKFEGINDINGAIGLIRNVLYIDRSSVTLPEGSYFEQDLLGLEVIDANSGRSYGRLTSVLRTGANDVYGVSPEGGREMLFPAIGDVVRSVDVEGGRMLITPLKGLFEDEN